MHDATATYDDAKLIMRLYELRLEPRMREARRWFVAHCRLASLDDFARLCPIGSRENQSFRMVLTYWDMVATLITAGVLDRHLFFESGRELLLVWERLRDVMAQRQASNDPMFKDLEIVGEAYASWMKARSPEAYEAFRARIR